MTDTIRISRTSAEALLRDIGEYAGPVGWLEVEELKSALSSPSPAEGEDIRCAECDNGLDKQWEYCPWCGARDSGQPVIKVEASPAEGEPDIIPNALYWKQQWQEAKLKLKALEGARSRAVEEALRFYAENWQVNADGDLDEPHLTRTWSEPTDALWEDHGRKAQAALRSLPQDDGWAKYTEHQYWLENGEEEKVAIYRRATPEKPTDIAESDDG